jgi:hypothetical protein
VESAKFEVARLVIRESSAPSRRCNELLGIQSFGKGINELYTVVLELVGN